jgi:hypothetical protein
MNYPRSESSLRHRSIQAYEAEWSALKTIAIAKGYRSRNDFIRKTIEKIIVENQETLQVN